MDEPRPSVAKPITNKNKRGWFVGFLASHSPMAERIRAFDWSTTSLGPIEGWPAALKTTASLIINSRFPQCIVWGADFVTIPNDAFLPILGDKPDALGRSFADVWAEAWSEIGPIAERALAGEATYIENFAMVTDRFGEAEEAFFTFCYSPIRDETGTILGFLDTVMETSPAVRAGRQLQLMNRELGHRLKNALAVTQAIAVQTIRRAADLHQAEHTVSDRLSALGRAADILTDTAWASATLTAVAHAALDVHGADRFRLDGPAVTLPPSLAISMALALHELATNAIKYGALSNADGRVDLSWRITDGDAARLTLEWRETGGPPVAAPTRRGFGTTLIERTLRSAFKGEAVIEYAPTGLVFRLEAPRSVLSAG